MPKWALIFFLEFRSWLKFFSFRKTRPSATRMIR